MTRLNHYLVNMLLVVACTAALGVWLAPVLQDAFLANVGLNGMILFVLVAGILYIFMQVIRLRPEIRWLEHLRRESQGGLIFPGTLSKKKPPRLLAPMATMLGEKRGKLSLSTLSCAPCWTASISASRKATTCRAT